MTEEQRHPIRRPERDELRLFGAPRPEQFIETPPGQALRQSAEIHFAGKEEQDRLIAIEKLALDIFHDSRAARAFAVNPEEYLRRAGFPEVKLDLSSEEVRIAMAMGDPDVSEAARRGDVEGFMDAVLKQGIQPQIGLIGVFGIELAVYFSAVAVSWVAAAYTVETAVAVHHKIGVAGAAFLTVEHHKNLLTQLADRLGDARFAREVSTRSIDRIIEEYVNLHKSVREQ